MYHVTSTTAAVALVLGLATASLAQDGGRSPNILGTWTGSATAAYFKSHPSFPDGTATVELELDVYKQQGNLFWVAQKWRREGQSDWNEANSVGSFHVHDDDEFIITEMGSAPDTGATGLFIGEIDDGRMEITYSGMQSGVSFSTALDRNR